MKRIKLTVAYDGTNYCGWQLQPNGITIEEVLNRALTDLLKEPVTVIGASRTDSGVHSLGNVAVFDTENRMPADRICLALNQRLPEDVRVQASCEVPARWHPRKQNCVKTYEYRILNRKIPMPTQRLYTHFCYFDLDEENMRKAAAFLVGEHDFRSFCTIRKQDEDTVRTIYSLTVERSSDDVITIRVSGSGFLYNMVRIIAGTLMQVGMGMCRPEEMERILAARDRQAAGPTAPARGLTLVSLDYEQELRPEIRGCNREWDYVLDQRRVKEEGAAFLTVNRCEDRWFSSLMERVLRHAWRNGAERILAEDRQGRLEAGQQYGAFLLEEAGETDNGSRRFMARAMTERPGKP